MRYLTKHPKISEKLAIFRSYVLPLFKQLKKKSLCLQVYKFKSSTLFRFIDTEPWLVFSNRFYIRKLSIDGHRYDILYQGLNNAVAMDFDIVEQRLYFMDVQVSPF